LITQNGDIVATPTQYELFYNGGLGGGTQTVSPGFTEDNNSVFRIGDIYRSDQDNHFDGYISEIISYSETASSTDRQKIESKFSRWCRYWRLLGQ